MAESDKRQSWKPGKQDVVFLAIVAAVVLALVLGSSDRTTKPVPNDEVHRTATTRAACMTCHGADGVRPQPMGHTKADQCFQCHVQPKDWAGSKGK